MATININELALKLDTTPRTARKFLRSVTPKDEQPGKGSRWAIEAKSVRSLKAQFKTYTEEHIRQTDSPEDVIDSEDTTTSD
jgi:hypothetical protein